MANTSGRRPPPPYPFNLESTVLDEALLAKRSQNRSARKVKLDDYFGPMLFKKTNTEWERVASNGTVKEGMVKMWNSGSWVSAKATLKSTFISFKRLMPEQDPAHTAIDGQVRILEFPVSNDLPLGVSIQGGVECDAPIVITSVASEGKAAQQGQLFVGDEVLDVDGKEAFGLSLQSVAELLQKRDLKTLKVRHSSAARKILMNEAFMSGGVSRKCTARYSSIVEIPIGFSSIDQVHIPDSGGDCAIIVKSATVEKDRAIFKSWPESELANRQWISVLLRARNAIPLPSFTKKSDAGQSDKVRWFGQVMWQGANNNVKLTMAITDQEVAFYNEIPATNLDFSTKSIFCAALCDCEIDHAPFSFSGNGHVLQKCVLVIRDGAKYFLDIPNMDQCLSVFYSLKDKSMRGNQVGSHLDLLNT